MREGRWFKWVCIILTLASLVVLLQAANKIKARNEAERDELRERAEAYDEAMKPLLSEKRRIERELQVLEDEELKAQTFASSVFFLCTEPDAAIMTDIASSLENYGYPGLLAVSEDRFFGDAGCLSLTQAHTLLQKGWDLCISVDAATDIGALAARFEENDLPDPEAVYYPDGNFLSTQEDTIRALGIRTVICYGEKAESELFGVVAYGSYAADAKDMYLGVTQAGDSIALTVGYTKEREKYSKSNFSAMLRVVDSGMKSGAAYVRTLAAAEDCYRDYESSGGRAFDNRRNELEERLQEINAQLWEQEK